MNVRKLKDIEFGNYYERIVIEFLNKDLYSNNKLRFFKNPFNVMDMVSKDEKDIIELKSRRIKHNEYFDIMIGLNKIVEAQKYPQYDYYMYFLCLDGLYGWKYDKTKKFDIRMGGRCDRGIDERKMCAFIPTKDLFFISSKIFTTP